MKSMGQPRAGKLNRQLQLRAPRRPGEPYSLTSHPGQQRRRPQRTHSGAMNANRTSSHVPAASLFLFAEGHLRSRGTRDHRLCRRRYASEHGCCSASPPQRPHPKSPKPHWSLTPLRPARTSRSTGLRRQHAVHHPVDNVEFTITVKKKGLLRLTRLPERHWRQYRYEPRQGRIRPAASRLLH